LADFEMVVEFPVRSMQAVPRCPCRIDGQLDDDRR